MNIAAVRLAASLAACLIAFVAPGRSAGAASPVKVGYADPSKALADTADGKKARAMLEKEIESKKKLLETKEAELAKAVEALEKRRPLLKPDAFAKEEDALRKTYGELHTLAASLRAELDAREREVTSPLYARLQCILNKIGEADGYTLILPAEGLLWAPAHLDLTSELTRKYEAGLCKDAKAAAAGGLGTPALKPPPGAKPVTAKPATAKPAGAKPVTAAPH